MVQRGCIFLFLFCALAMLSSVPWHSMALAAPFGAGQLKPQIGPLPVKYGKIPSAQYLRTACRTNNQSIYVRNVVEVTLEKGELAIFFPMNPAMHLTVDVRVKDGAYTVALRRPPLQSTLRTEHTNAKAALNLDKQNYAVGDVVYGYLDLSFTETMFRGSRGASNNTADASLGTERYYFTGPFSAIVRPTGFDPEAADSIAGYTDLAMAMQALPYGGGASELRFSPDGSYTEKSLQEVEYWQDSIDISAPQFMESEQAIDTDPRPIPALADARKNLFTLRNDPNLVVWEVCWSIGPESFYGTNGDETLVMWFVRSGDLWKRIGYTKIPKAQWNQN